MSISYVLSFWSTYSNLLLNYNILPFDVSHLTYTSYSFQIDPHFLLMATYLFCG